MQPSYSGFAAANASLRAGQSAWDNASPPEDPAEAPDLSAEVSKLMAGSDSELAEYSAWTAEAEEDLFCRGDLPAEGWFADLIIRCSNSQDAELKAHVASMVDWLKDHAAQVADREWERMNEN